jgi:hypothetical protein
MFNINISIAFVCNLSEVTILIELERNKTKLNIYQNNYL